MERQKFKSYLLLICGGVAFYCLLQHLGTALLAVRHFLGMLTPFLLGGAIAFVLNVPMRAIERRLPMKSKRAAGFRRPLALILTLASVGAVLALASGVIVPGVTEAVMSVARQAPGALDRLQRELDSLSGYLPPLQEALGGLEISWSDVSQRAIQLAQDWGAALLSTGGGVIGTVISGVGTFVIGLIFSLYILLQKETLARQGRQVLYALLPLRAADRCLEVLRLANRTFSGFLSGQCLEACILGSLFVVSMTVLRMPCALLVGVLITLTALIPMVGAFIGCGVGALLIAVTDPWKALLFILLFLALQQVEGNLIYPRVVGSSVGLPSIWVLAAVTLGGSLMGVLGMLVFIPLCSVVYALFRSFVKGRLRERRIPAGRWLDPPPESKGS